MGWDGSLSTFYGHVLDEGEPIVNPYYGEVNFGINRNEVLNPYLLAEALSWYARIPDDLVESLLVHRAVDQLVTTWLGPASQVVDPDAPELTEQAVDFVILHTDGRIEPITGSAARVELEALRNHAPDSAQTDTHGDFCITAATMHTAADLHHNRLADYLVTGLGHYNPLGWGGPVVVSAAPTTGAVPPLPASVAARIDLFADLATRLERDGTTVTVTMPPVVEAIEALTRLREIEPDYPAAEELNAITAAANTIGRGDHSTAPMTMPEFIAAGHEVHDTAAETGPNAL